MIEKLEEWDRQLFLFLNGLHVDWLDQPMYWMSNEYVWIPLYLFLLWLIAKTYNWKIALLTLLGIAIVITIGDRTSVEVFKEGFERYRPSRNFEIRDQVHTVNNYRGGQYGFVSSHATNFFGIATFLFLVLRRRLPQAGPWLFFYAALIAYTRIYLGVHYPGDIIGGAILGSLVAILVFWAFNRFVWTLPSKT